MAATALLLAFDRVRGGSCQSVSSAIVWTRRYRETGSVAPGKFGGYEPNILGGAHRDWLVERARTDFILRGLVAELAACGVKVDYVQVRRLVHARGLSFKKSVLPGEQLRQLLR